MRLAILSHHLGQETRTIKVAKEECSLVKDIYTPEAINLENQLNDFDALIVRGGTMNVSDQNELIWMTRELELLKDWRKSARPLLGICLGAQMVAHSADAEVYKMQEREYGWPEVTIEPTEDPLLEGLPHVMRALSFHSSAINPKGSNLKELAHSRSALQAFQIGNELSWGVQFHPDPSKKEALRWIEDECKGQEKADFIEGCDEFYDDWGKISDCLIKNFLAITKRSLT